MNLNEIEAGTKNVLNSRIADGSRGNYDGANVKFFIWLYEFNNSMHHNLLQLQEELIVNMVAAHAKDEASVTKRGKKSKTRNFLRKTCFDAIHGIVVSDATTFPIKLEEISFAVISQYLSTFLKQGKGTDTIV
jgi:hypothetical protein